jgi:hypothetical protein
MNREAGGVFHVKGIMVTLVCIVLIAGFASCSMKSRSGGGSFTKTSTERQLTVEEMSQEAEAMYQRSFAEGRSKDLAVLEAADYLRRQKNVAEVKVLGSDSLRVIFTDGNDLVMLLGRGRQ